MDFGVVGLDQHHHGLGISSCSSSSSAGFGPNNVISSSSSDPETKQRTLYGSGLSCNNNNNGSNSDILKQERSVGSALEEYWRSSKVPKTSGCGGVDDDDFSSVCKGMMFQQRNSSHGSSLRSNSNTASTTANSTTTTLSFLDSEQQQQHQQQQQSHQMLSFSTSSAKSEAQNFATLPCYPTAYTARNTAFSSSNGSSPMHGGVMMMRSAGGGGGGGGFTAAQWMELEHQALIYKYITANVPIPSNLLLPIRKAYSSPFPSALLRSNPLGMGGWGAFQLGFTNNADPEPGRCRRTDGKKWRCSRDAVADQKYCERHMNRGRHRSRKPVEGQTGANNNTAAAAKPLALTGVAAGNANHQVQTFEINGAPNRMFMKDNNAATPNGGLSLLSSKENNPLLFPRKEQPTPIEYDMSLATTRSSHFNGLVAASDPQQGSLHQFIDDWPNKPRAATPWADLGPQSERTQLSISIPTTETNLSPLRLSREHNNNDNNIRQAGWIPISWGEASLGGPLGEVLHHTNNNNITAGMMSDHCKSSSSATSSSVLNLMPEGWDSSPPMGSSPTGVLQRTAFGSLSNSSAGSSPRAAGAHQHQQEGIDLLGGSSTSLPAL